MLTVKIEFSLGTGIDDAIYEASEFASKVGASVQFDFNDIPMMVQLGERFTDSKARYERLCTTRKMKAKRKAEEKEAKEQIIREVASAGAEITGNKELRLNIPDPVCTAVFFGDDGHKYMDVSDIVDHFDGRVGIIKFAKLLANIHGDIVCLRSTHVDRGLIWEILGTPECGN